MAVKRHCNYCGIAYRNFVAPEGISWADAQEVQWQRSKDAVSRGDYSKPVTRRAVLGKMREWKLASWNAHLENCANVAALETLYGVDQDELADRGQWTELAAIQDAIRELEDETGTGPDVPF